MESEIVRIVEMIKQENSRPVSIAEIGVFQGDTSCAILGKLEPNDSLWLFDYQRVITQVSSRLDKLNTRHVTINYIGNSEKILDSYVWPLAKLALEHEEGLFDLVYLDGSHTVFHDLNAGYLAKLLLKTNGIIIFDDLYWSYQKSPTANPKSNPRTAELYTDEQIEACQVAMVVELLMKNDRQFEKYSLENNWRSAFRKLDCADPPAVH